MASTGYGMPQGFAGTSTARKHPHTPVRDNNGTSDNIIYIYNRASRDQESGKERCNTAFYMALGYYPAPYAQNQIAAVLALGVDYDFVIAVLEYTAEHAPRPSWAYAQAVMRRKIDAGITTAVAFLASVAEWYSKQHCEGGQPGAADHRRGGKTVWEQRYEQREYDPARYTGLTAAELAEVSRYDT